MSCLPSWHEHSFIRSPLVLPQAIARTLLWTEEEVVLLLVGDDWAEEVRREVACLRVSSEMGGRRGR